MSNIPEDLRYTEEHEWVKKDGENIVVGVTHHAQEQLGDVVFLELPDVGAEIQKGEPFGVVESVKAVSDLFGPIDGEVVEVNSDLVDTPETVNEDPYGAAWLLKIKPADATAYDSLLDAAAYTELVAKEDK